MTTVITLQSDGSYTGINGIPRLSTKEKVRFRFPFTNFPTPPKLKASFLVPDHVSEDIDSYYINYTFTYSGPYFLAYDGNRFEFTVASPLPPLSMLTVHARCLGPIKQWYKKLVNQPYNCFHFSPIVLHAGSAYSIIDPFQLDDNNTFPELASFSHAMNAQNKFIVTDLVLNHLSPNSPFIAKCPEATYNTHNTPHLIAALLLDISLAQLSNMIAAGNLMNYCKPTTIDSNAEIFCEGLWKLLTRQFLPEFNILKHITISPPSSEIHACTIRDEVIKQVIELIPPLTGYVNWPAVEAEFLKLGITDLEGAKVGYCRVFNTIYAPQEAVSISVSIVNSLIGHVKYDRFNPNGAHYHMPITKKDPLFPIYFAVPPPFRSIYESDDYTTVIPPNIFGYACNGWVMGVSSADFIYTQAYMRREVVAWSDCIKLRYFEESGKRSCPELWAYMSEHCKLLASHFNGFRIDNAHSTPVPLLTELLEHARAVNPNLFIMAELFTSSKDLDKDFVVKVGCDALVRELYHWNNMETIATNYCEAISNPLGSVAETPDRHLPVILYDQTHDNPTIFQFPNRTPASALANAALIAAAPFEHCASTWGVDLWVRNQIPVTSTINYYTPDLHDGMILVRKILNELNQKLNLETYKEFHLDKHGTVFTITRRNPLTDHSYIFIIEAGFNYCFVPSILHLQKKLKLVFTAAVSHIGEEREKGKFYRGSTVRLKTATDPSLASDMFLIRGSDIMLLEIPSGSIIILETESNENFINLSHDLTENAILPLTQHLTTLDISYLLYTCKEEQLHGEHGYSQMDAYYINGSPLVYTGYMGPYNVIKLIGNDLGHPIYDNIRRGPWLLNYLNDRLIRKTGGVSSQFSSFYNYINFVTEKIYDDTAIPAYLRPKLVSSLIRNIVNVSTMLFLKHVSHVPSPSFIDKLLVSTGSLYSANAGPPTMSAGLPHFAEGIWREWGRDTFIALPGLLLTTHRYEEAKQCFLEFLSVVRHGLVPNLYDGGRCPRYNARDATWFCLRSLVMYLKRDPSFADERVTMKFPSDNIEDYVFDGMTYNYRKGRITKTVMEIIEDIIEAHVKGIRFIEWNAGPKIDSNMSPRGFEIVAGFNEQGFVHGGSIYNCGTWMDHMNPCTKFPDTPRNGAAIELVALSYFVLSELNLHPEITTQIRKNFELCFWNPDALCYKDCYGADPTWQDVQIRPNQLIALAVAPSLFDSNHATAAIGTVKSILIDEPKQIGVKTVSPHDWAYQPIYDPSLGTEAGHYLQGGASYHNGPEWVFPYGYYLQALKNFMELTPKQLLFHLKNHEEHVDKSVWSSLPELTHRNGAVCGHSCEAQAWSIGTILEAMLL